MFASGCQLLACNIETFCINAVREQTHGSVYKVDLIHRGSLLSPPDGTNSLRVDRPVESGSAPSTRACAACGVQRVLPTVERT